MRILLANDDGVEAPGIEALVKALYKEHEVIVSAPAQQQSGMSHAMTLGRRLYIECYQPFMDKYGVRAWRVYGTPADSVKAYLEGINEAKPDVVISGINDCHNLGTDNIYSGQFLQPCCLCKKFYSCIVLSNSRCQYPFRFSFPVPLWFHQKRSKQCALQL